MVVVKSWVLPVVRALVAVAIAVALVKLAFFAGTAGDTSTAAQPTGTIETPRVAVARGTITNDVAVKATIQADESVPARATLAGTVGTVTAKVGQAVAAGERIGTIVSETPGDPVVSVDGASKPQKPVVKTAVVTAPVEGVISSVPVIADQATVVGDTVAVVVPKTLHVSGVLTAEQQYRLVSKPTEAMVSIAGGPAPFPCSGVTIGAPTASAAGTGSTDDTASDASSGGASTAGGVSLRCAVPDDVTVFPGLTASVTVPAGVAENVLVVPLTAVEGAAGKGIVRVAGKGRADDGKREVVLGLNDGKNVEVISGLDEGQQIVEFVPGAAVVKPQNDEGGN